MMSKKEMVLFTTLRKNARLRLTLLSRKANLPITTTYQRLKTNNGKLIKGYTALFDFSRLGFSTHVFLLLKCEKKDKEALREYLEKQPNVNTMFRINHGYDYMLECFFRSIKELEEFTEQIEAQCPILAKTEHYIIDTLTKEEFFSDMKKAEMLLEADDSNMLRTDSF